MDDETPELRNATRSSTITDEIHARNHKCVSATDGFGRLIRDRVFGFHLISAFSLRSSTTINPAATIAYFLLHERPTDIHRHPPPTAITIMNRHDREPET